MIPFGNDESRLKESEIESEIYKLRVAAVKKFKTDHSDSAVTTHIFEICAVHLDNLTSIYAYCCRHCLDWDAGSEISPLFTLAETVENFFERDRYVLDNNSLPGRENVYYVLLKSFSEWGAEVNWRPVYYALAALLKQIRSYVEGLQREGKF